MINSQGSIMIRVRDHGSTSRITDLIHASRIAIDLASASRSTSHQDHVLDEWIKLRMRSLVKVQPSDRITHNIREVKNIEGCRSEIYTPPR